MNPIIKAYYSFIDALGLLKHIKNPICNNCGYKFNQKSITLHPNCSKKYFSMGLKRRRRLNHRYFNDPSKCSVCNNALRIERKGVGDICPKCDHFWYR